MFIFICLALISGVVNSSELEIPNYDIEQAEQLFEDFVLAYGKTYSNQNEKQKRRDIFKENLKIINELNSEGGAVFDINHYADLTKKEIEHRFGFKGLGSLLNDDCKVVNDKDITTKDAPDSMNWTARGAVTAVRNQLKPHSCGSCYAFATIGNIEAQYFIKHNNLLSFAVQEIVDCSKNNYGCAGGFMSNAMTDLKNLGGVELESSYPYEGEQKTCRFNSSKVVAKIADCLRYDLTDEVKLKEVVANRGPISIAISTDGIVFYKGGIVPRKQCNSSDLTHAVLVVGYGTDNGTDYWLIKNTSGPEWGEKGYLRITRGENTCSMMNQYAASAIL